VIPARVHQVWVGAGDGAPEPPARLHEAAGAWRTLGTPWEYRLWRDEEIEALFQTARPDLLPLYRSLPYAVQKADIARYLILAEHGGVYADLDVVLVHFPDEMSGERLILAPTHPVGVSIDFMATEPGHPLMTEALNSVERALARWHRSWVPRHFRVMAGTGSLHLSRTLDRSSHCDDTRFLTADEYGHGRPELAWVRHIDGNTWAEWDTHVLVFLSRRWKECLALVLVLGVSLIASLR